MWFNTFFLCIPKVHNFFIKTYGKDSIHLLGWNIFSGVSRTFARAVALITTGEVARTGGEVRANTVNDRFNYYNDRAHNALMNTKREQ